MIGTPWIAAAALALSIGAGGAGYVHGVGIGKARQQLAHRAEADRQAARTLQLQAALDVATERAATAETARQQKVRSIARETHRIIERPVYRSRCVDADGVGLLDRAAATANGQILPASAGSATGAAEGGTGS